MESFIQKMNSILSPWIACLSTQKHIQALKLGIIASMPLCIGCGIVLVISLFVHSAISSFDINMMWFVYQLFLVFLYFFIAYEIGKQLANSYEIDKTMGGMLAALSSGIVCITYVKNVPFVSGILTSFFPMLVISLLSGEVFRLAHKCHINLMKLPSSVNEYIDNLFPILICMVVMIVFTFLPSGWIQIVNNIFLFLTQCFDSLIGILLIITLTCLFWLLGIHGVALISAIARPFWLYMLLANSIAFMQGSIMPYSGGEGFYQWFVWIGGSGTTIGLALWVRYMAKSKHLRSIGRGAVMASCFNINEPIIFGTPMALNPYMIIPFLIVPILAGTLNYYLIQSGLMNAPFLLTGWVFPAPLGALLACGGDIRVLLGVGLTFVISILCYAPFFIAYDKKLAREEDMESIL